MENIMILMSTYNGEKYLEEQLLSLKNQKGVNLEILVRDDGSTDNTVQILKKWHENDLIEYYVGENKGAANSFMDLILRAPETDYYAFCDQDDVWKDNKLITAIKVLSKTDNIIPALYFSKAQLVDSKLNFIGYSNSNPVYNLPGTLLGNQAIGCTMVYNKTLINILKINLPNMDILHDAWALRACLAVDGHVFFDENPYIYYRQHENNVIGVNNSNIKRLLKLLKNSRKNKNKKSFIAKELLRVYSSMMNQKNFEIVSLAANYQNSIISRFRLATNKSFRRNNRIDNILFVVSVLCGYY